jgi:hypothetical protein
LQLFHELFLLNVGQAVAGLARVFTGILNAQKSRGKIDSPLNSR